MLADGQTWCSHKCLGIRRDRVSLSGIAGCQVVLIKGGDLCPSRDREILLEACENGKRGDAVCGFEDGCTPLYVGGRCPQAVTGLDM